ncbi:MAG: hypothetical protein ACRBI6_05385 [Acidimicrobiales bacterium]
MDALIDEHLRASEAIARNDPGAGALHFCHVSRATYHLAGVEGWPNAIAAFEESELASLFRRDPLTRWSAERPRGYPGDAGLLDLIYDHVDSNRSAVESAGDSIAAAVNAVTWNAPEPAAVRWRRAHIAEEMARRFAQRPDTSVLSVASGHCRELELIDLDEHEPIWLVDQDEDSLAEAKRSYGDLVEPHHLNISSLLRDSLRDERFDLIYSLGLFDYLDDRAARLLLSSLQKSVATGGELIVANFAPWPVSIGYMESAMRWKLIYRTELDLRRIWEATPLADHFSLRTYRDPAGTVVYLAANRRN